MLVLSWDCVTAHPAGGTGMGSFLRGHHSVGGACNNCQPTSGGGGDGSSRRPFVQCVMVVLGNFPECRLVVVVFYHTATGGHIAAPCTEVTAPQGLIVNQNFEHFEKTAAWKFICPNSWPVILRSISTRLVAKDELTRSSLQSRRPAWQG